jgi:uncharacterized protein (TIGR00645 family)
MDGVEKFVERIIFASRWLQVPLYLGLVIVLGLLTVKFYVELLHHAAMILTVEESELVLNVLTLVDLVMVANLLIMVVISGYENFVSRIDLAGFTDKLSWFGKLDAGSLKIKLASSIVAISAIHLLKAFLDAAQLPTEKLVMLVVIHLTFVISALMLAYLDRLLVKTPDPDKHH